MAFNVRLFSILNNYTHRSRNLKIMEVLPYKLIQFISIEQWLQEDFMNNNM